VPTLTSARALTDLALGVGIGLRMLYDSGGSLLDALALALLEAVAVVLDVCPVLLPHAASISASGIATTMLATGTISWSCPLLPLPTRPGPKRKCSAGLGRALRRAVAWRRELGPVASRRAQLLLPCCA
jgi:hypothetical protein